MRTLQSWVLVKTSALLLLLPLTTFFMQPGRTEHLDERVESEKRLMYDLFEKNGYNPLIRPVRNFNDSLKIHFNLALSQIINVDEVNQVMKTNVWLQIYWNDYQLKWDPAQYGNIVSLKINPDKVWVPDFVLFNNADGNFEVTYKSNCVLSSDSLVYWIPPAIFHSSCAIDVKYFPFDQQICEMKFGSNTYKGNALTYSFYLNRDKLDLTDYLKSGSWDILDGPGRISKFLDPLTGEERGQIVFEFVLRRKSLFYTINLIMPCVLMSLVTVFVFALPAKAGEKIVLCISVLLALVVFMLLVSKILPPSITIPMVARYLLFTFVVHLVAIMSTVIIISRNYRAPWTQTMPYWVRVVFLRELPKYLLMSRPNHGKLWRESSSYSVPPSFHSALDIPRYNCDDSVHKFQVDEAETEDVSTSARTGSSSAECGTVGSDADQYPWPGIKMTPELRKTTDAVQFIAKHIEKENEYDRILEDWKYVARVLDRTVLLIFLLGSFAGTAFIILNVPHLLESVDQDQIIKDLVEYIRRAEDSARRS